MNRHKENTKSHRKCTRCKGIFSLTIGFFGKDINREGGLTYLCRKCEKKRSRERYLKNPRKFRYSLLTKEQKKKRLEIAYVYRKTKKGRAIVLLKAYQSIDKAKGLECDLTKDFILELFEKQCTYCGCSEGIGCDRVDNRKGHTISNIIPACGTCNILRSNLFTVDEMKLIGRVIMKIRKKRNINNRFVKN